MIPSEEAERIETIRRRLLQHFDHEKRELPWRGETDPYRVWVSEVMLQQTRVQTVEPYYRAWVERFPDVAALATADRAEVLRAWEGLGYYSRARNLHQAAWVVRDRFGGKIPDTAEGLRELPGIGEYTAGAVASIAFGRAEPAVDGNARRVLARLFDLEVPTAARLREIARRLVPEERPGDFNQAVMELGATVCAPRSPACAACPVEGLCLARRHGTEEERPRPRRRGAVPEFDVGVAVALSPAGRALLVRRSEDGMLGGMWEFPGAVADGDEPTARAASRAASALLGGAREPSRPLDRVEHAYSHRRHVYHAFLFEAGDETDGAAAAAVANGWVDAAWAGPAEIAGLALPAAQRKLARALAGLAS